MQPGSGTAQSCASSDPGLSRTRPTGSLQSWLLPQAKPTLSSGALLSSEPGGMPSYTPSGPQRPRQHYREMDSLETPASDPWLQRAAKGLCPVEGIAAARTGSNEGRDPTGPWITPQPLPKPALNLPKPQGAQPQPAAYTGGEDTGGCLVEVEGPDTSHPICDEGQDVAEERAAALWPGASLTSRAMSSKPGGELCRLAPREEPGDWEVDELGACSLGRGASSDLPWSLGCPSVSGLCWEARAMP